MSTLKGNQLLIAETLKSHEASRDDDNKLYAMIIYNRLDSTHKHEIEGEEREGALKLLSMIYNGKLPNFDTLARFRRKLQEENVELRGQKYDARHKRAENYTEEHLGGEWKL